MKAPEVISSRLHPLVKELRDIRDGRSAPLLFCEGPRLVQEAMNSRKTIDILVWTPSHAKDSILESAMAVSRRSFQVTETVFLAISDVESPQGILAVTDRPTAAWENLVRQAPAPIVILDGLQDPGNLATIVRTAEAAGAVGVVTTPGTAHLYSPKALRSAMGSTLRLPCLEHQLVSEIHGVLNKASYRILAAVMSDKRPSVAYTSIDWKQPNALLLGREGRGCSPDWDPIINAWVHIPMRPPVESLNVAAAAAVLLYEFSRHNA